MFDLNPDGSTARHCQVTKVWSANSRPIRRFSAYLGTQSNKYNNRSILLPRLWWGQGWSQRRFETRSHHQRFLDLIPRFASWSFPKGSFHHRPHRPHVSLCSLDRWPNQKPKWASEVSMMSSKRMRSFLRIQKKLLRTFVEMWKINHQIKLNSLKLENKYFQVYINKNSQAINLP